MTTTAQLIAAEKQARIDGDAKLQKQIDALGSAPAPPSTGVVRTVQPGITAAQLEQLAADLSIDTIAFAAGTYHLRNCVITTDRTARPLTIRGATIDCANDHDYGDSPFIVTGQHMTFDGFRFQHILLAQAGLFTLIGAGFITARNIVVRNVAANAVSNAQSSHVIYVSHGCHDLVLDDFDVAQVQPADEPFAAAGLNGLHLYTGGTLPAIKNVAARRWIVNGANWATVARNGSTGLVYDGWQVTGCGRGVPAAMDFGSDNTGSVSNCRVTGSIGTPVILGRMTDGGGNSWA